MHKSGANPESLLLVYPTHMTMYVLLYLRSVERNTLLPRGNVDYVL